MAVMSMKEQVIEMEEQLDRIDPERREWFIDKGEFRESYCKECMAYRLVKGWAVMEKVIAVDRDDADEPVSCSLCQAGMEDCPEDRWEE